MGGRKINDRSFMFGKGSDGSPFPKGVHTKAMASGEGAGELNEYEDTAEKIKASQDVSRKKVKSHSRDPMYRN